MLTKPLRAGCRLGRRATQRFRVLPDFIIIGTQKGGTTSLYRYLCHHPQVLHALGKGIHFFDSHFDRGDGWYRSHFHVNLSRKSEGLITGESSPDYMIHPRVPDRIASTLPEVKLIALLRNPIDRAYSHYAHELRKGREALSFDEAIEAEEQRLSGEVERMERNEDYDSWALRHFSYLTRGRYADQLERWLSRFPLQSFLFLRSEDLYENPASTTGKALEFLGLPALESREFQRMNPGNYADSMGAATRIGLEEYFRPYNARLERLIGPGFSWDDETR
jgi:hypothetical protein